MGMGGGDTMNTHKRRNIAPNTITRQTWQEAWAHKFAWVEGKFDSNGDFIAVV